MGPKKVNKQGGSIKVSSSMKQIDDFIGQSELADGAEASQLSMELQKQRAEELTEKFFETKNPAQLQRNMRALTEVHIITTIFTGIAAGLLGFDGLMGLVFFAGVDIFVAFCLFAYFGFKAEPYFLSII